MTERQKKQAEKKTNKTDRQIRQRIQTDRHRQTYRNTNREDKQDRQTDTKKQPKTNLEQLVQRAEASRGDDERLAVVEHPELSREKVVELER